MIKVHLFYRICFLWNCLGKSGGQTIILEEKITKKTPKFGAQATNKPLKKINLTNATPYCFEVINKNINQHQIQPLGTNHPDRTI